MLGTPLSASAGRLDSARHPVQSASDVEESPETSAQEIVARIETSVDRNRSGWTTERFPFAEVDRLDPVRLERARRWLLSDEEREQVRRREKEPP